MGTLFNVVILKWVINGNRSFFHINLVAEQLSKEHFVFESRNRDLYMDLEATCLAAPNLSYPLETKLQLIGKLVSNPVTIDNDERD